MTSRAIRVATPLALALSASIAWAAASHAADKILYVSATGSNANACTLQAPCRTLRRGIMLTSAGGELHVLDSGSYGPPATIDKAITIAGNGATVYGASIIINGPGAVVTLRGLVMNGGDSTADGIVIDEAGVVNIERCVIGGYTNDGIRLASTGTTASLFVSHSSSSNNGHDGLVTVGTAGSVRAIDNSRFENNGTAGIVTNSSQHVTITNVVTAGNGIHGISVGLAGRATIARSTTAQNGQAGYIVGGGAHMIVEDSVSSGNGTSGLEIFGGSGTAAVSNSAITRNNVGLKNSGGGVLLSRGNNTVFDNTTDVSGTITALAAK